jgi:two-component system phosphate regulon response regulator OmpR
MKATAILPRCKLGRRAADPSRHRPVATHMPARRPLAAAPGRETAAPAAAEAAPVAFDLDRSDAKVPHILHIDQDKESAQALASLLMPEARVTHVSTLAGARQLLAQHIFSAVVIDPNLPDGNAVELLPSLTAIPLLVYSASQPAWREGAGLYLPKPWATPRQLWTTISRLLGIATPTCAGD